MNSRFPYSTLLLRRDEASVWTSKNPLLGSGEPGFEIDTNKLKIGNGIDNWNSLDYIAGGAGGVGGDLGNYFNTNLVAGSGISFVYNSGNSTLTINSSGEGGLTLEQVDDRVGQLLVAGTGIYLNYNDEANSLTISTSGNFGNDSPYTTGVGLGSIQPISGSNIASGTYSNVTGGKDAIASLYGEEAHSAGKFYSAGDAQVRKFILRTNTDGVVQTINGENFYPLLLDGGDDTINGPKRIVIPSDASWFYTIKVVARQDNNGNSAAYEFKGTLKAYELYGATLMPYLETILYEDVSDWHVYIRTINNQLDIYARVPDDSAGVVYWVAYVEVVQVIAPPPPDEPPPSPSSSSSESSSSQGVSSSSSSDSSSSSYSSSSSN